MGKIRGEWRSSPADADKSVGVRGVRRNAHRVDLNREITTRRKATSSFLQPRAFAGTCYDFGAMRENGTVKWFNAAKGFGFIPRESGDDVFVHFSAIGANVYRTLEEGARVSFLVKKGPKRLQAEDVTLA